MARHAHADPRTKEQEAVLEHFHLSLTVVLSTPLSETKPRVEGALAMLKGVVICLQGLGLMARNFIRELCKYGEQALRAIEATLGHHLGGLQADFSRLEYSEEHGMLQPKHLAQGLTSDDVVRRGFINNEVGWMNAMAVDDSARVEKGQLVLSLCAGAAFEFDNYGKITKLAADGNDSAVWEAEKFDRAMMAVIELARCLSSRYMGWEVEIRGQLVPGTGIEKEEALNQWWMIEPKSKNKKGHHACKNGKVEGEKESLESEKERLEGEKKDSEGGLGLEASLNAEG